MSLNYADRLAIRSSQNFQQRVQACVSKYALYIRGEDPGTSNHANRYSWHRDALNGLANMADRVSFYILDDSNFGDGGTDMTDVQLQGAVETAINAIFITPA